MAQQSGFSANGHSVTTAPGRGHAVVIGGSMAGLLAARVLAAHFARVTVVERDSFPAAPEFRKGVPQSRHVHVLLGKGQQLVEQFFPGILAELKAEGAVSIMWPTEMLWLMPAGWCERFQPGFPFTSMSRELLEWCVRRRLAASPRVTFVQEHDVTGLLATPDHAAITGVHIRARGQADADLGPTAELPADLVVDSSGRGSHTPRWLEALGYAPPAETRINSFLAYASRYYAPPDGFQADWKGLFFNAKPPHVRRGGALFPVEGGRWLVTLAGIGGEAPPLDDAGFLEFARGLRSPIMYEVMKLARPLGPVAGYRRTENQLRHYERLQRFPERLLVTGDAACAFNPIYGQGMTVAALDALALHRCLRAQARQRPDGELAGLGPRFQKAVAEVNATPWLMATGEDLRYPTTEGARPGLVARLMHRYFDRVNLAATSNAGVNQAFGQVINLLAPPSVLFRPSVLLPALFTTRDAADDGIPPTATPIPLRPAREAVSA
jgi:2-polyprenyl-6-methoxyphenol hydroxylase-like FAD-dependent oxidoreductase